VKNPNVSFVAGAFGQSQRPKLETAVSLPPHEIDLKFSGFGYVPVISPHERRASQRMAVFPLGFKNGKQRTELVLALLEDWAILYFAL